MKSKLKYFMVITIVTVFILSSVSIVGQTQTVLASSNNSSSKNQSLPAITLFTGTQSTNTLAKMIADFNANFSTSYGFTVKLPDYIGLPTSTYDMYKSDFQAQSSTFDVLSMDVTWPAEFARDGYILPLNNVFNSSYQTQFLQADIATGTYNGQIYSVPWDHVSGMLYYRSDILQYAFTNGIIPADRPPQTWSELTNWTLAMMQDKSLVAKFNLTSGFVWQGKSYEGLICDLMEYLGATGTHSFLTANQSTTEFDNSSGLQDALRYMKSLITSGVSPITVLTSDEEATRSVWNAGNAIFMRNWPYAYILSMDSAQLNGSLVSGIEHNIQQFNVTAMPAENSSIVNPKTACLGGYQLSVNAYSTHPTDAKKFILWLTASEQQQTYFFGAGNLPTLKAIYNSYAVLNSNQSYISQFLPIFESSIPRPISPNYLQISKDLQPVINSYLAGGITLATAITNMTSSVNSINKQNPLIGPNSTMTYLVSVLVIGLIVCIAVVMYYPQYKKRGLKEQRKKLTEKDSGTYTTISKSVCNVCGSELKPGELFCSNCGNRL